MKLALYKYAIIIINWCIYASPRLNELKGGNMAENFSCKLSITIL